MIDFKAQLAAKRAKDALDKQLAKVKGDSAPTMNPSWTPRKKKEEPPPPPDLRELDILPADRLKLSRLTTRHASISQAMSELRKEKEGLVDEIKPLCKIYELDRFQANGQPFVYYKTTRATISKALLLANGVSPEVIEKSTTSTETWAFKSSGKGEDNGTEE